MTTSPAAVKIRPLEGKVDRLTYGLALANLWAQITIIVTGGLVRLTGSGLGCSTWPQCEPGTLTPVWHEATSYHPFVEFGNRTLTGVLGFLAVALLVALYVREPVRSRPRIFKVLAWSVLVGIGAQAVIGGMSVLWELHPAFVGSHMYVSLILVAVSAYLVARLKQEDGPAVAPSQPLRALVWVLLADAAVLLVLGVLTTGAGPHSGDSSEINRLAIDPLLITRIHSASVWLFIGLLAAAIWLTHKQGGSVRVWVPVLLVSLAQGAVGYFQYFSGLPILMVALHMTLAAIYVAVLTIAATELHPRASVASIN